MATKKEKRAAGLAKRAALTEKLKAEGLVAQKRDKEWREARLEEKRAEAIEISERYEAILERHGMHDLLGPS